MPTHGNGIDLTVAIPTKGRPQYLEVVLRSLLAQQLPREAGYEVVVVADGVQDGATERLAQETLGDQVQWHYLRLGSSRGLNAARNAALAVAQGELVVFVDDDVELPFTFLASYLIGAKAHPDSEAFGGPIVARFERERRTCGREKPPITTLDLGPTDRSAERVWGANMAIRRSAFGRVGQFDESFSTYGGDEEDWQKMLLTGGGRITYLAGAWLWHRRDRSDSRLVSLCRAAYRQGRGLRAHDRLIGRAVPLRVELRVLAGCVWHTGRFRCANGPVMAAHTLGRIREALAR